MSWLDTQDQAKVDAAIARLSPRQLEHGGGDPRFALWLRLVDRAISKRTHGSGFGHRDMVDWRWTDAFEAGQSPREAAEEGMENDEVFAQYLDLDE